MVISKLALSVYVSAQALHACIYTLFDVIELTFFFQAAKLVAAIYLFAEPIILIKDN